MLMPKRVKWRKQQRGKVKGRASRGNKVAFGDFGLQALEAGWLRSNVIETGRVACVRGAMGAAVFTSDTCFSSAWMSSTVRSFGTPPKRGIAPVVSVRPGNTMTRLDPSDANSPVT